MAQRNNAAQAQAALDAQLLVVDPAWMPQGNDPVAAGIRMLWNNHVVGVIPVPGPAPAGGAPPAPVPVIGDVNTRMRIGTYVYDTCITLGVDDFNFLTLQAMQYACERTGAINLFALSDMQQVLPQVVPTGRAAIPGGPGMPAVPAIPGFLNAPRLFHIVQQAAVWKTRAAEAQRGQARANRPLEIVDVATRVQAMPGGTPEMLRALVKYPSQKLADRVKKDKEHGICIPMCDMGKAPFFPTEMAKVQWLDKKMCDKSQERDVTMTDGALRVVDRDGAVAIGGDLQLSQAMWVYLQFVSAIVIVEEDNALDADCWITFDTAMSILQLANEVGGRKCVKFMQANLLHVHETATTTQNGLRELRRFDQERLNAHLVRVGQVELREELDRAKKTNLNSAQKQQKEKQQLQKEQKQLTEKQQQFKQQQAGFKKNPLNKNPKDGKRNRNDGDEEGANDAKKQKADAAAASKSG